MRRVTTNPRVLMPPLSRRTRHVRPAGLLMFLSRIERVNGPPDALLFPNSGRLYWTSSTQVCAACVKSLPVYRRVAPAPLKSTQQPSPALGAIVSMRSRGLGRRRVHARRAQISSQSTVTQASPTWGCHETREVSASRKIDCVY